MMFDRENDEFAFKVGECGDFARVGEEAIRVSPKSFRLLDPTCSEVDMNRR